MQNSSVLDSRVLVLNKFFAAIHIVNAKRAFLLLCKESAEVISIDNGQYNSYNFSRWVEVSAYKAKCGLPEIEDFERVSTFSREIKVPKIIARDENRCQYCGKRYPLSELSLDHIIPRSKGGENTWANIVCACTECNKHKGGRKPEEAGMKLIRKPVKPRHCPNLRLRLNSKKYQSWKQFLDNAYWSVPLV